MLSTSNVGFVFVVLAKVVFGQLFIDDLCTISSTGASGVCKLLNECPKAIEDLRKKGTFPETCGYEGSDAVVCCPKEVKATSRRQPGEISYQKCQEHTKLLYETKRSPVLLIRPPTLTKKECGHKVETLIIGGEKAKTREFPHQAAIGFEENPGEVKWLCGGTILSENYILTAAHCLRSRQDGEAKYVLIGVSQLNDTGRHRQQIKVQDRIPYPQYKSNSHYHDIGLLKLETAARLDSYTVPACLYTQLKVKAEKAIATGWGHTTWAGEGSNDLLKVTLDLFQHTQCNESHVVSRRLRNGILDDLQMCAGSIDAEKDTCQGDSGGPLQIYHLGDNITCMYDVIGVTSFGEACGLKSGVYVRVSHYTKWIEDIVWPEN